MLFKELRIKDFLIFKGTNLIEFPSVDESDSSLVLVLAANNAGKTSIIRALRFLCYGDLLGYSDKPFELINKAARNDAQSNIDGWVQATFIDNKKTVTFKRSISAIKIRNGYNLNSITLQKIDHKPDGDRFAQDQTVMQRQLEKLVPKELFDYFYFQGEDLAKQLMEGTRHTSIASGFSKMLHIEAWTQAASNVLAVGKKFEDELRNLVRSNREYHDKLEKLETFRMNHNDFQDKLKELASEDKEVNRSIIETSNKIIGLTEGGPNEQWAERLKKCRLEQKKSEREIIDIDNNICRIVSDTKGIPFLVKEFSAVSLVLKEMQDANLLPADITEGFVERLLKSNTCICGRPLHLVENQVERNCIDEYRNRSLSSELNSGLMGLLNALEEESKSSYKRKVVAFIKSAGEAIGKRKKLIVKQYELGVEIEDLEQKLSSAKHEEVSRLLRKARTLNKRRLEIKDDQTNYESRMKATKRLLDDLNIEVQRIANQRNISEENNLLKCQEHATQIHKLIHQSLRILKKSFHEIMQSSISQYYDTVVTDGTKAYIDPESLLPAIKTLEGDTQKNIGGGQRQLLVISHIIALSQLRRELHNQLYNLKIGVGKLDDQSFFMDSIFAPTDDVYARHVANILHGKARQILLLLAQQQWHESVRGAIEPHTDKVYRFRLFTNKENVKEEDYFVNYQQKKVSLVKLLDNKGSEEISYSRIEEIN